MTAATTATYIGLALAAASAATSIASQAQQADASSKAANATAKSLQIQGDQEKAASQMRAKQERDQAAKVNSNIQAAAAASGAGASDIGVTALSEDVAGEGEYRSLMQMYQGEQAARNLQNQASVKRFEGASAKAQLPMQMASTILGAGTSYLSRYKKNTAGSWEYGGGV